MIDGRLWDHPLKAALLALALFSALPATVRAAVPPRVAITVDDLPIFPELPSRRPALAITRRLLAGFARHRWPVTGFVNEGQLEDHPATGRLVLQRWVGAGYGLGNHTYSHASLSKTPVADYIRDIRRGDHVTRPLLAAAGRRETWFRYPYLATGRTLPDRRRVERWLARHGYRIAPVSLVNADWQFAEPYDAALKRGDRARALAIRRAYMIYTRDIIAWTRARTAQVLGREPAYVLLLHASRLNAETIEPLAGIVAASGLHVVPLATAAADPAYRLPDTYVGIEGQPSLPRWALRAGKPLPRTDQPQVPADIVAEYDRIEAADPDARTPLPDRTPPPTRNSLPRGNSR